MRQALALGVLLLAALLAPAAQADEAGLARPTLLLKETVAGMPTGDLQEIKVLTATLQPGDRTVFHSHHFPVTVYILEGAFSLEMEGRDPVTITAGQSFVEPPGVRMTGYNRLADQPMRVVIFYVSDRDAPFLDPVQ